MLLEILNKLNTVSQMKENTLNIIIFLKYTHPSFLHDSDIVS